MIADCNATTKSVLLVCLIFCGSAGGQAQSPNQVELTYDDGDGVTGELLEFADGRYRLKTSVGVVTIYGDGVSCNGAACPDSNASPDQDEVIKLTSLDGTTTLFGELLEVKDGMYVVSTSVGIIEIEIDLVNCEGEGCVLASSADKASE